MAKALTAARALDRRNDAGAVINGNGLVVTSETIYQGSLVFVTATGTYTSDISNAIACVGVALETVLGDGVKKIRCISYCEFLFPSTSVTAANLFVDPIYAVNDTTVTDTAGTIEVGFLTEYPAADTAWVMVGMNAPGAVGAVGPTGPTGPTG